MIEIASESRIASDAIVPPSEMDASSKINNRHFGFFGGSVIYPTDIVSTKLFDDTWDSHYHPNLGVGLYRLMTLYISRVFREESND